MYGCTTFLHSSVDGHLGCVQFGAILNNTTMNIHVDVFMRTYMFILRRYYTKIRIDGAYGTLCLAF